MNDLNRAAWSGVVVAVFVAIAAAAEITHVPTTWHTGLVWPMLAVTFWVGWLPTCTAVLLGTVAEKRSERARKALLWAAPFAGVAAGLGASVWAGEGGVAQLVGGLAAVVVLGAFLPRVLPTLAEATPGFLAPISVGLVLLTAFCAATSRDVTTPVTPMMQGLPILVGVAAVAAQVFHHAVLQRGIRWSMTLTALTLLPGLGASWWLAGWLPELNNRLKLAVVACLAFATLAFAEPLLRRLASRRAALVVGVAGALVALIGTLTATIPERFGGLDPRWVSATGVVLLSVSADQDGDGFYTTDAGGNDCDDDDPRRHPLAPSRELTCLQAGKLDTSPAPTHAFEHVLVIIVDALRQDTVIEHGGSWPAISRIGAESLKFTNAYSPGNSTFNSLPSLLTGIGPQVVIGAIAEDDPVPYSQLVAGKWIFDRTDRCTAFIVAAHHETDWLFDFYPTELDTRVMSTDVDANNHSSPIVPSAVKGALDTCADRATLFAVYLDDPHLENIAGHSCDGGQIGGFDCYLDEISAVDRALAGVIEQYQARGLWESTAVILTSDHGEAFGERGHTGHTSNVFEEQVRVPLWIRLPGSEMRHEETPVSGLAVSATALALAGVRSPGALYRALASVDAPADSPPPVTTSATGRVKLAWTSVTSGVRVGDLKLVHQWTTNTSSLYDLAADPGELRDLAAERPEEVQRLRRTLETVQHQLLTSW